MSGGIRARRPRQNNGAGRNIVERAVELLVHARVAVFALLAVAAATAFVIALAAPSTNNAPAGQGPQWVPLASTSPSDILAAVRASSLYQEVVGSQQSDMGQALQHDTLGTPVLVHVYHPEPGQMDVWVIPVLQGQQVVALLDYAYDATNRRISAQTFSGPFLPSDPLYNQPFPRVQAQQAMAMFARTPGRAAASGAQPQLVYFPVDPAQLSGQDGASTWQGGGQIPDLAVWRIPDASGHDYIVGANGTVYSASALPLAPQASK